MFLVWPVEFYFDLFMLQLAPLLIGGNDEQKKKFAGRLLEEPLMAVSIFILHYNLGEKKKEYNNTVRLFSFEIG